MEKPTGQYHHGDLRRAILSTALELVELSGVDALTLRAVAQRLGVSHAAPVYHFPSKSSLLMALAEEGFRLFAQALEAAAQGPQEGRLLRIGQAYIAFARQHPNHYHIMFGGNRSGDFTPTAAFQEASNRALSVLVQHAGDPPEQGFGERALFAWSLVHGMVTLRTGPLLCNLDAQAAAALDRTMEQALALVVPILSQLPPRPHPANGIAH